jgi:hypothetical protein
MEKYGLLSFIVHPDNGAAAAGPEREVYEALLFQTLMFRHTSGTPLFFL